MLWASNAWTSHKHTTKKQVDGWETELCWPFCCASSPARGKGVLPEVLAPEVLKGHSKRPKITFYHLLHWKWSSYFLCVWNSSHSFRCLWVDCPYSGKSVMLMHGGLKFSCIASHECWNHDGTMLNATLVCRLAFSEHRTITRVNPSQCPNNMNTPGLSLDLHVWLPCFHALHLL